MTQVFYPVPGQIGIDVGHYTRNTVRKMNVINRRETASRRKPTLLTLICAASVSLLITGSPAEAGYIVTLAQVGPNVVATGSGAINLAGLALVDTLTDFSQLQPHFGIILTGPTD